MKAKSALILKRKAVKYEDTFSEKSGEKSIAKSQKSNIDFNDQIEEILIQATDKRWAKFFKPGESALPENELKKRKHRKFKNHRFYLQLSTLCDRIKIIQGELTEEQKIKINDIRKSMIVEEVESKKTSTSGVKHRKSQFFGSIKSAKFKKTIEKKSMVEKNLDLKDQRKSSDHKDLKVETATEESFRSYTADQILNSIEKKLKKKRSYLMSKKSSIQVSPQLRSQESFSSQFDRSPSTSLKRLQTKTLNLRKIKMKQEEELEPKKDFEKVQQNYIQGYISRAENVYGFNSQLKAQILNKYKQSEHELQVERDIAQRLCTLNAKHPEPKPFSIKQYRKNRNRYLDMKLHSETQIHLNKINRASKASHNIKYSRYDKQLLIAYLPQPQAQILHKLRPKTAVRRPKIMMDAEKLDLNQSLAHEAMKNNHFLDQTYQEGMLGESPTTEDISYYTLPSKKVMRPKSESKNRRLVQPQNSSAAPSMNQSTMLSANSQLMRKGAQQSSQLNLTRTLNVGTPFIIKMEEEQKKRQRPWSSYNPVLKEIQRDLPKNLAQSPYVQMGLTQPRIKEQTPLFKK